MDEPDRRARARPHEGARGLTDMFDSSTHAADLWARKRRLVGTCLAVLLGVAFLAGHARARRHDARRLRRPVRRGERRHRRRRAQRDRARRRRRSTQRGSLDASLVDTVAAVDGVAGGRARGRRATARSSAPTASPIGGNGPPTVAGNWIDDADLNPWRLAEGRAPGGRRRGRHRPARGRGRRPRASATARPSRMPDAGRR